MKKNFGPPGWSRASAAKRYANVGAAPRTFDRDARTAEAVLSKGSAVPRSYGLEKLRISKDAVDLSRLHSSGVPLLDSHEQRGIANALGKVTNAWIEGDRLVGSISFNRTPEGERAMRMVERGELTSLSVGYTVSRWQCMDEDGNILDPDRIRLGDDLTFEATRWQVLEVSLVAVPADADATFRSFGSQSSTQATSSRALRIKRIMARHRMVMLASRTI